MNDDPAFHLAFRPRQPTLQPGDLAVALQLILSPERAFRGIAYGASISTGEAHNAVRRLRLARLVNDLPAAVARPQLLEFIIHGVPYAFPVRPGDQGTGVPTSHSAPGLSLSFPKLALVVWPVSGYGRWGRTVTPLYPAAVALPESNPRLYRLLALVDAVRLGERRVRERAISILEERVGGVRRRYIL